MAWIDSAVRRAESETLTEWEMQSPSPEHKALAKQEIFELFNNMAQAPQSGVNRSAVSGLML